jgi:hypothetical protein
METGILYPYVRRVINLASPTTIVVPSGLVYKINRKRTTTAITAGQFLKISIDSECVYWGHATTTFDTIFPIGLSPEIYREKAKEILDEINTPIIAIEGQSLTIESTDNSGVVVLWIEIFTLDSGYNRNSEGAVDGNKSVICSISRHVQSVGAGLTVDIQLTTNSNPVGKTLFPFAGNVPPQKRYKMLGMIINQDDTVGTNLTLAGLRLVHEGRDLISSSGVITPATLTSDVKGRGRIWVFDEPITVNSFEAVQVFGRVTSTDAGAQNATLECGIYLEEEILG